MNNKGYVLGLIVVAAVIVGYLYWTSNVSAPTPQTTPTTATKTPAKVTPKAAPSVYLQTNKTPPAPTKTTTTVTQTGTAYNAVVQISYTDKGFSPARIIIHRGQTVQFLNMSGGPLWVASDPEPSHTGYPGFDQNGVALVGESYRFTFNQVGTFGYDNHVDQAKRGTIIVE